MCKNEEWYGDFTPSGRLSKIMYELKQAAERWNPPELEDTAVIDRPTKTDPIPPVGRAVPDECHSSEDRNPEDGSPIKSGKTGGSSIELRMTTEDGGHRPPYKNRELTRPRDEGAKICQ